MKELVLASNSLRRREILYNLGLRFKTIPNNASETLPKGYAPEKAAIANALRKARDVAEKLCYPAIIIGADTIVVLEGEVMGKPADKGQAFKMLSRLSGRKHNVITGLAVVDNHRGEERTGYQVTSVQMRNVCPERIKRYISTGEPFDKAGAYAVQGRASVFIHSIEGCYYNVVGLPVTKLDDMLKSLNVDLFDFCRLDNS